MAGAEQILLIPGSDGVAVGEPELLVADGVANLQVLQHLAGIGSADSRTVDCTARGQGCPPWAENPFARRTVRLVRKAVVSLSTTDTEAAFVLHATALANLSLPDLIVAARYAAALTARHAPAAVQTMVGQAADALDPDRR